MLISQQLWGQEVILWMPLLLSAKKALAYCLDLTELRNSEGLLVSLISCRLAYILSLGFTYTTGRTLTSVILLTVCSPTVPVVLLFGCILIANGRRAARGHSRPVHSAYFTLGSVPKLWDLLERNVLVSSTWSSLLPGSCLNGAVERILASESKNLQSWLWQQCQGPFYSFFAQGVWGSPSSIRMLCDPGSLPHHTPWPWF